MTPTEKIMTFGSEDEVLSPAEFEQLPATEAPDRELFLVSVHYGSRSYFLARGPQDEATARKAFMEAKPKKGHRGPRPVVRLWRLEAERKPRGRQKKEATA